MSKFRFGERPDDQITIEEIRLAIAALAGPFRLMFGSHDRIAATANAPVRLAINRSAKSLFVDVRAIENVVISVVLFSPRSSADPSGSIAQDLSATIFQHVLLPSEELWMQSGIATSVLVSTVQV